MGGAQPPVQQRNKKERTVLKDNGIPLYYQLETILRQRIFSGDFELKAPLPSEEALGQEYNVSRITVRQALASLEREGLIVRRRGKGTFVSEKAVSVECPKLTGFMEDLISMGIRTTAKLLDVSVIQPPPHVRERLRLGHGARVVRFEKVRLVEGSTFSHVFNYLPKDIGEKIEEKKLSGKPLLMILEDDLGIKAAEAVQTVEATVADSKVAPLLEVRVGDPLLKVERTVFDRNQRPVEYVSVLYRSDKYFFTVRLKRRKSEKSAGWRTV